MPSFDVVSKVDKHELSNAVDQANREIANRFDFKGSDARIEQADHDLTLIAPTEFQIKQILDILQNKLTKRNIDIDCLACDEIRVAGNQARQTVAARDGIDTELARTIVKRVKNSGLKVQAAIQQDQIRITGKKRDDLQAAIGLLKQAELGLPLQFINFRD